MYRFLSRGGACSVAALCLCSGLVALPVSAAAETVDYSGGALQNFTGFANALTTSKSPFGSQTVSSMGNSVTLTSGAPDYVFGAIDLINTFPQGSNRVFLNGGTVAHEVYGGYSAKGPVQQNKVTLNDTATVQGSLYGGFSTSDSASMNYATVAGGVVNRDVYGGFSSGDVARANDATVAGGAVNGNVYGGMSSTGNASTNFASVSGGSVAGNVYGGYSAGGNASGNGVTLSGGSVHGNVYGGFSETGDAINNTVIISGSPVLTNTILFGGGSGSGDARTGNTLYMRNSGVSALGIANFGYYTFMLPSAMTAGETMLTVTQGNGSGGAADISNSVVSVGVQGGVSALQPGDQVTLIHSNTGLVATGINSRAVGIQGISRIYDFDLTTDAHNLYATVAPLDPSNGGNPGAGSSDGGTSGGGTSQPSGGGATSGTEGTRVPGAGGSFSLPAYRLNPQLKALSEGHLAGLAFASRGADLIIGAGMSSAIASVQRQGSGFVPFAAASGGSLRYATGSHIDADGFSVLAGLAWRSQLEARSAFLIGTFFEAGWGNYSSYNGFVSVPSVRGDGDTEYYGGGLLARYEMPVVNGSFYGEASLRAGHVSTTFASGDILNSYGNARYDSGSAYYGAHAGLGYVWKVSAKTSLDLSTKYIWTHQGGDSVTISGDVIRFASADSQRWRTGARYSYAFDSAVTLFTGAYYDHEFDGRARATANGDAFDAPKLTGGTGIGELGVTVKPSSNLALDLALQGYVGVRRGVGGNMQVKYEF